MEHRHCFLKLVLYFFSSYSSSYFKKLLKNLLILLFLLLLLPLLLLLIIIIGEYRVSIRHIGSSTIKFSSTKRRYQLVVPATDNNHQTINRVCIECIGFVLFHNFRVFLFGYSFFVSTKFCQKNGHVVNIFPDRLSMLFTLFY